MYIQFNRLLSCPEEGRVTPIDNNWGGGEVKPLLIFITFSHPRFVECDLYAQELDIQR